MRTSAPTRRQKTPSARGWRFRYALRHSLEYAVDLPDGPRGRVAEIEIPPYEHWPDAVVAALDGDRRARVPIDDVVHVLPAERRLVLDGAPPGTQPGPRPQERRRGTRWAILAAALLGALRVLRSRRSRSR